MSRSTSARASAHAAAIIASSVSALFTACHCALSQRFTRRGRGKVDGQWKLYGLTHNIEKPAHPGYAH